MVKLRSVSARKKSTTVSETQSDADPDSVSGEASTSLALKNINIFIRPGENVAICGHTGSAKSSFLALLIKLLDPLTSSTNDLTKNHRSYSIISLCTASIE